MFGDVFDDLLMGKEVKFDGKTYFTLKFLKDGLIMAVERGARMPATVVVIKDPDYKEEKNETD